jgi:hypothetical protein
VAAASVLSHEIVIGSHPAFLFYLTRDLMTAEGIPASHFRGNYAEQLQHPGVYHVAKKHSSTRRHSCCQRSSVSLAHQYNHQQSNFRSRLPPRHDPRNKCRYPLRIMLPGSSFQSIRTFECLGTENLHLPPVIRL